jgi:Ras-related C3 botulinum toxin substrate 1
MKNIKCVIVGDGTVGKTCLLVSFTTNSFPREYVPTVFDNYSANMMYNHTPICLNLWDTAGQEDYDKLRPLSYPQTDIFLICYSIAYRPSFHNIKYKWIPELKYYSPSTPFILVGLKMDLRTDINLHQKLSKRNETMITYDEGKNLSLTIGAVSFIECSALTQQNVIFLFQEAIGKVISIQYPLPKKRRTCYLL